MGLFNKMATFKKEQQNILPNVGYQAWCIFVLFIKEIFIACDTSRIKETNYHLLRFCNQVLVVSDSLGVLLIENHDISGNLVRSMSKFSKLLTYERKKMNKNTCFCIVLFLLVEIN